MATAVGNLYVKLSANTSAFAGGMKKAGSSVAGFASRIKSAMPSISGMTAMLTGGGLVAGAMKAVSAAREQIAQERKLAAVLKATGGAAGLSADQMRAYASELQRTTNFGDEVTLNAMSVMATFRNVTGENFKRSIALAQDMSTVFGTDLSSASMQLGKALNDPIAGISALTRVGVTFSDAQKEQIKYFAETNQLAKAQGIILDELANQVGGASSASADQVTQLSNAFGDLAESIGMVISNLKIGADGFPAFTGSAAESLRSLSDVMGSGGAADKGFKGVDQAGLAKMAGDIETSLQSSQKMRDWGFNMAAGLLFGDPKELTRQLQEVRAEQERRASGRPGTSQKNTDDAKGAAEEAAAQAESRSAAFGWLRNKYTNTALNMVEGYKRIYTENKSNIAITRFKAKGSIAGWLADLAKPLSETKAETSISALSSVNAAEAGSAAAHALMADAQSPVIVETKKNGKTLREIRDKLDFEVAEVPA